VTHRETSPADCELLLERSAGREFPIVIIIIILFARRIAPLIIPFRGVLIARNLWRYRPYFGPRARRWFRVLGWISALYAVGFALWSIHDVHAHPHTDDEMSPLVRGTAVRTQQRAGGSPVS